MDQNYSLHELQEDFRATSTRSMPIAGMICWAALGLLALRLDDVIVANLALYIMAAILPLAFLLERIRGRSLFAGGTKNPLTQLFLWSIAGIALTVPVVVLGAQAGEPLLLVLGMAILAGVIWIPYGWAAADPVGMQHAVLRSIGVYAAFAYAPEQYQASAVCAVVVVAYLYSLIFMKR